MSNPGQQRFDRWAPKYDRSVLQKLYFEPIHDAALDALRESGGRPHDLLDVGCGTGRLLENAAGRWDGVHLTGIDASQEMIDEARHKHVDDARYTFTKADASALPLEAESTDAAFSTMSFHHWSDQPGGLREVARVLRPGGFFILADMHVPIPSLLRPLMRFGDHAHLQTPQGLARLLAEAGLSVVTQRHVWPLKRTQLVVARKAA